MVESNAIEAVFQRKNALDLVRLNHCNQHIAYGESHFPVAITLSAEVIRDSENGAEIVGWMSPFSGEPGVIVIEPAYHRADVEGRLHRVQFVTGPRHPRSCSRHRCAGNN